MHSRAFRHPFIINIFGVAEENDVEGKIIIIMEYGEKGSLDNYFGSVKLTRDQKWKFARQLTQAVHYLHSKNALHRDIKSCNCLVRTHFKQYLIYTIAYWFIGLETL